MPFGKMDLGYGVTALDHFLDHWKPNTLTKESITGPATPLPELPTILSGRRLLISIKLKIFLI